jgi:hypothetical protein
MDFSGGIKAGDFMFNSMDELNEFLGKNGMKAELVKSREKVNRVTSLTLPNTFI